MTLSAEKTDIDGIVYRMMDNLAGSVPSQAGTDAAALRYKIGDLRANHMSYLYDKSFTAKLQDCFNLAASLNAVLLGLAQVREGLFAETATGVYATSVITTSILICLATEATVILDVQFSSRDDIDAMMSKMASAFDTAQEFVADIHDPLIFQSLIKLGGSLINHLANTARPLPRIITFNLNATLPALALSNRIYYDPNRYQELINENKVVHPAFMPRDIRGLSS